MFAKNSKAKSATVLYGDAAIVCPHCNLHVLNWEYINGWRIELGGGRVVPFIWHGYRVLECPECHNPISIRSENRMRCPR